MPKMEVTDYIGVNQERGTEVSIACKTYRQLFAKRVDTIFHNSFPDVKSIRLLYVISLWSPLPPMLES